ncbi:type IV pilin protein [Aquabacterium sp. OR-4]|uniref:type IV pilin protein n=1 Tax=Aquabacterium sp. OR-4 TaxID=2978127 RepID=UPI0021B21558|nr:type IV pilin protein [Aquabacterium sp. OR-4]MDT7836349.1 type IV pilin protein [Aquabacterium sp. OR-4]
MNYAHPAVMGKSDQRRLAGDGRRRPWPFVRVHRPIISAMSGMLLCPPRRRGFTLIEMLITLAVVAILATVAWPTYQNAVRKGRRADAMAAIAQVMQAQERWRSERTSYKTDMSGLLPNNRTVSADGHYAISLADGSVTATGYTVLATVQSGSPQASDSVCATMRVVVAGGSITYGSLNASNVANAAPDPCWIK